MCGTLMAYDITSAEGRVHYAGFFDPGFFAPATLEVRVHHSPFRIVDGQPICIMQYEHMRSEPRDERGELLIYGSGKYSSNYQNQQRGPNLGKQFLPRKAA
jgi:dCTP deaminase